MNQLQIIEKTEIQTQTKKPTCEVGFKRNIFSLPMEQELNQFLIISKHLSMCPFYQKLGSGGILAIFLTAKELNLPPMMCLNGGMYTFSGQVTLSSQLMNMMIRNAGHRIKLVHLDKKSCTIRFLNSNGDIDEFTYTAERANIAGYLTKKNWKENLEDMLFARTMSGGARKFMPDAIMGCYTIGELSGNEDGDIMPTNPVEFDKMRENLEVQAVVIQEKKYISAEQVKELDSYVECLTLKCRNNFLKYLMTKNNSESLELIPEECFDKMVTMLKRGLEASLEERKLEEKKLVKDLEEQTYVTDHENREVI